VVERGEWIVVLPELEPANAMGNGTVASPWNGVEIVELVLYGLRIVLTVRGLLIRPVCEDHGNSDTWWISSRAIVDERLWGISGGTQFGNDVQSDGENVIE